MTKNELLPCPFCPDGGKPVYRSQGTDGAVWCDNCDARGPIIDNEGRISRLDEPENLRMMQLSAEYAWSTRADRPAMDKEQFKPDKSQTWDFSEAARCFDYAAYLIDAGVIERESPKGQAALRLAKDYETQKGMEPWDVLYAKGNEIMKSLGFTVNPLNSHLKAAEVDYVGAFESSGKMMCVHGDCEAAITKHNHMRQGFCDAHYQDDVYTAHDQQRDKTPPPCLTEAETIWIWEFEDHEGATRNVWSKVKPAFHRDISNLREVAILSKGEF